jgi:ribosomal protein S18 acetylase RimI-like enzyme
VVVTTHAALASYRGLWLFVCGRAAVVSAPTDWRAAAERAFGSAQSSELLSREYVLHALGGAVATIVGPSYQGWLPPAHFRPLAHEGVRILAGGERAAVAELRASVSPEDWEHGGIDPDGPEIFAAFDGNGVTALGQLRAHGGRASDPCVITRPAARGQGSAVRVVSAMVERALAADRLVLYQTLRSNAPALAIARRLGFESYATLLSRCRVTPGAW